MLSFSTQFLNKKQYKQYVIDIQIKIIHGNLPDYNMSVAP